MHCEIVPTAVIQESQVQAQKNKSFALVRVHMQRKDMTALYLAFLRIDYQSVS